MMIDKNFGIYISLLVVLLIGIQYQPFAQTGADIFTELQQSDSSSTGEIILYQDASVNVLIDRHKRINKKELKGYRIQIYRGSGQSAREDANKNHQYFMSKFPDFDPNQVHTLYESPFFKLRVGNYRTKNEAFEFLHQVKKVFPNAYIVATSIKFPKLEMADLREQENKNK